MEKKDNYIEIYSIDSEKLLSGKMTIQNLIPENVEKVISWYRTDYWHIPVHSSDLSAVRKNTQNILIKTTEEEYIIMLGLVDHDNFTSFIYSDGDLWAEFSGTIVGQEHESTDIIAYGKGEDPFALSQEMFELLSKRMGSFKMREDKVRPDFVNYFGWCTWDAFYHTVDAEKLEAGLKTFDEIGLNPGFVILDDGALSTEEDYLNSFELSKEKFPEGLSAFVDEMKDKYSLKKFGLWHAFEGYWTGLNPEGELAKKYGVVHNKGDIRPWIPDKPLYDLYLVSPDRVGDFFDDWYKHLKSEKVDFVKVDGQSAMEIFTEGVLGRSGTMSKFQHAMQDGVANNLGEANVISCMSNGSDVYYNLKSGNVWRNSNDYFPAEGIETQKKHIYYNIYNAFLTSNFAWTDWDMFQSYHDHSEYHAIGRALSGGPVYVCDYPGKQNKEIISKLMLEGGRVPIFDRPAMPTKDTLMTNALAGEGLAKITNVKECGDVILGQIGVFNCDLSEEEKEIKGKIRVIDIPEFAEKYSGDELEEMEFAVYDVMNNVVHEIKASDEIEVGLRGMSAANFVVSPIINGTAVLGVEGKYAMAACVDEIRYSGNDINVKMDEAVPSGTEVKIYKK